MFKKKNKIVEDPNVELYDMAIEEVFKAKETRDNLQNTLNHCDPDFFEVLNAELTSANAALNAAIARAKKLGELLEREVVKI